MTSRITSLLTIVTDRYRIFKQRISWDWPSRMDETAGEQGVSMKLITLDWWLLRMSKNILYYKGKVDWDEIILSLIW